MMERSILIIGAGLAGLSCGCYAQMNGYQSRIFEHRSVPGGVAACWKRQGYLIDGGIHFLMDHRPGSAIYDMYCELGTAQANRFPDLTTYACFVDEATGRSVEVTTDLGRLARDLKALFPADAQLIDDLVDKSRATQGLDWDQMGMSVPPELSGRLDFIRQTWRMRRFLKLFTGRYARPVGEYAREAHDPWLRWIIEYLFLPEVPAWFLFMLLGMVADGRVGLLAGGSIGFVLPIEKRYKALGGQVTYQATVEEILVEQDRAVGVRLADGSEHRADVVVSAADGYSTVFNMLGGRYVDEKIKHRFDNWPLIPPYVAVSFGVAREFAGEPWLHMIRLEEPFAVGDQIVGEISLRIFNYSDRFAPPGKTVVQVGLEAEWDYWRALREDMARYQAEKERVAAEVLRRLERRYPAIWGQVEMTDVATPYTAWRYTLNHRGAYMGWLPTPEAIMTAIPRTLPGLKSFYLAGQWVLPGGGVPPCLYSGRHVVQILCHRDGRPFRTTRP